MLICDLVLYPDDLRQRDESYLTNGSMSKEDIEFLMFVINIFQEDIEFLLFVINIFH